MSKILLLVLVLLSVVLGYTLAIPKLDKSDQLAIPSEKKSIMRVALIADSHNENDLLAKALRQAQGHGINFVIGLGDYTNLGTVEELRTAKAVFDRSGLEYHLVPGDRDGWASRQNGSANNTNFVQIFGQSSQDFVRNSIHFVLLDNSDIYSGIDAEGWNVIDSIASLANDSRLVFVFAHKTPFHPESSHVMGEDSEEVSRQARKLMDLMEQKKVDGFFSGDLHFFAQFKSPQQSVRITTVGAVASLRNFQGPRFAILTIYDDYSWEVEDVEVRI